CTSATSADSSQPSPARSRGDRAHAVNLAAASVRTLVPMDAGGPREPPAPRGENYLQPVTVQTAEAEKTAPGPEQRFLVPDEKTTHGPRGWVPQPSPGAVGPPHVPSFRQTPDWTLPTPPVRDSHSAAETSMVQAARPPESGRAQHTPGGGVVVVVGVGLVVVVVVMIEPPRTARRLANAIGLKGPFPKATPTSPTIRYPMPARVDDQKGPPPGHEHVRTVHPGTHPVLNTGSPPTAPKGSHEVMLSSSFTLGTRQSR